MLEPDHTQEVIQKEGQPGTEYKRLSRQRRVSTWGERRSESKLNGKGTSTESYKCQQQDRDTLWKNSLAWFLGPKLGEEGIQSGKQWRQRGK